MNAEESKKTEDEPTPEQQAAFRYFVRLNKLFAVALFVIALIFVAIFPSAPRVAGIVILAGLTVAIVLVQKISLRKIGFVSLFVACVTAIVATLWREGWPVEPDEISKWAVGIGAVGVMLIVSNKKTGQPNTLFQNCVGALALLLLVTAGGLVIVLGAATTVATPLGLVALEGVGALVEMAGEKWKVRLALAALFPIGAMVFDHVQPEWFHRVFR
ncbi:MAG: hypothetical protein WA496_13430 [Candidatus Udaeobacter sp.]